MNWSLDPLIETRGGKFCAISERACRLTAFGTTVVGQVKKRPAIILLIEDNRILGWDMAGRTIAAEEIERRYAGALATLLDTQ